MTVHYVDKANPDLGSYEIVPDNTGDYFRWQWREVAKGIEYRDCGHWEPSVADAYLDAADDWENNGNSSNRRLSGQLRAAATRAEKGSSAS